MPDVIVIGGGPAGSTAANLLAQEGFSVLLLERERFPRFQIGESLLPYNNDLFRRLGITEKLATGDFFPKYGAQFVTGDGSVGATFRFDQNLPPEYQQAFQVKRAIFDDLLLRHAEEAGVEVREECGVASVSLDDPERAIVKTVKGEEIEARFVLDASGHNAVLGTRVGEKSDIESLKKIAFFAHYRGVEKPSGRDAGHTVIVILQDAWIWMIPVSDEVMSIGLVVDRDHYLRCKLTPEEILTQAIAATPFVADRMRSAERLTQVHARKDFSFRMRNLAGPNFALIGDAAGFMDPIFSTGVFMAMKSADIAAKAAARRLRTGKMSLLRRYERDMNKALSKYLRFISYFYRREFLEVFLRPSPRFGLLRAIVGVLAGNVFTTTKHRFRLALFFALVRIQKRRPIIAPPIAWEDLPAVASM